MLDDPLSDYGKLASLGPRRDETRNKSPNLYKHNNTINNITVADNIGHKNFLTSKNADSDSEEEETRYLFKTFHLSKKKSKGLYIDQYKSDNELEDSDDLEIIEEPVNNENFNHNYNTFHTQVRSRSNASFNSTNPNSKINSDNEIEFVREPSLESYQTLTTGICENEEVYLLNVGGLRSSIPRRKIGSWINVSRYKIFLHNKECKQLETDVMRSRKKILLDNKHLPVTFQGYWVPLSFARKLAENFDIFENVKPLLEFNRLAKTLYCGYEFYEIFVRPNISSGASIRVLRRCDNNYFNLDQLFDVYETINGSRSRKNLRRLFLNEYTGKGLPLLKYGDATLVGGSWIPLANAREICDHYNLTKWLLPLLSFDSDPQQSEFKPQSRTEFLLLNSWKIINSNFVSSDYQVNSVKRYFGFPMEFKLNPNINKLNYKMFEEVIQEEESKQERLSELYRAYKQNKLSLKVPTNLNDNEFFNTTTSTYSMRQEIFDSINALIDSKRHYLERLGKVIQIRLKESKRNVFKNYYVFRRYSDGKVNLSSLLSTIVALRLNKLSRSDKDPDMQIENELYYRDSLNLIDTSEIYVNFDNSFIDYLTFPAFFDQDLKNTREYQELYDLKDEMLMVLKNCVNGRWGDIHIARDLVQDFHFNSDDNVQHFKLNEILYSNNFDDKRGGIAAHEGDFDPFFDPYDSDLQLIEEIKLNDSDSGEEKCKENGGEKDANDSSSSEDFRLEKKSETTIKYGFGPGVSSEPWKDPGAEVVDLSDFEFETDNAAFVPKVKTEGDEQINMAKLFDEMNRVEVIESESELAQQTNQPTLIDNPEPKVEQNKTISKTKTLSNAKNLVPSGTGQNLLGTKVSIPHDTNHNVSASIESEHDVVITQSLLPTALKPSLRQTIPSEIVAQQRAKNDSPATEEQKSQGIQIIEINTGDEELTSLSNGLPSLTDQQHLSESDSGAELEPDLPHGKANNFMLGDFEVKRTDNKKGVKINYFTKSLNGDIASDNDLGEEVKKHSANASVDDEDSVIIHEVVDNVTRSGSEYQEKSEYDQDDGSIILLDDSVPQQPLKDVKGHSKKLKTNSQKETGSDSYHESDITKISQTSNQDKIKGTDTGNGIMHDMPHLYSSNFTLETSSDDDDNGEILPRPLLTPRKFDPLKSDKIKISNKDLIHDHSSLKKDLNNGEDEALPTKDNFVGGEIKTVSVHENFHNQVTAEPYNESSENNDASLLQRFKEIKSETKTQKNTALDDMYDKNNEECVSEVEEGYLQENGKQQVNESSNMKEGKSSANFGLRSVANQSSTPGVMDIFLSRRRLHLAAMRQEALDLLKLRTDKFIEKQKKISINGANARGAGEGLLELAGNIFSYGNGLCNDRRSRHSVLGKRKPIKQKNLVRKIVIKYSDMNGIRNKETVIFSNRARFGDLHGQDSEDEEGKSIHKDNFFDELMLRGALAGFSRTSDTIKRFHNNRHNRLISNKKRKISISGHGHPYLAQFDVNDEDNGEERIKELGTSTDSDVIVLDDSDSTNDGYADSQNVKISSRHSKTNDNLAVRNAWGVARSKTKPKLTNSQSKEKITVQSSQNRKEHSTSSRAGLSPISGHYKGVERKTRSRSANMTKSQGPTEVIDLSDDDSNIMALKANQGSPEASTVQNHKSSKSDSKVMGRSKLFNNRAPAGKGAKKIKSSPKLVGSASRSKVLKLKALWARKKKSNDTKNVGNLGNRGNNSNKNDDNDVIFLETHELENEGKAKISDSTVGNSDATTQGLKADELKRKIAISVKAHEEDSSLIEKVLTAPDNSKLVLPRKEALNIMLLLPVPVQPAPILEIIVGTSKFTQYRDANPSPEEKHGQNIGYLKSNSLNLKTSLNSQPLVSIFSPWWAPFSMPASHVSLCGAPIMSNNVFIATSSNVLLNETIEKDKCLVKNDDAVLQGHKEVTHRNSGGEKLRFLDKIYIYDGQELKVRDTQGVFDNHDGNDTSNEALCNDQYENKNDQDTPIGHDLDTEAITEDLNKRSTTEDIDTDEGSNTNRNLGSGNTAAQKEKPYMNFRQGNVGAHLESKTAAVSENAINVSKFIENGANSVVENDEKTNNESASIEKYESNGKELFAKESIEDTVPVGITFETGKGIEPVLKEGGNIAMDGSEEVEGYREATGSISDSTREATKDAESIEETENAKDVETSEGIGTAKAVNTDESTESVENFENPENSSSAEGVGNTQTAKNTENARNTGSAENTESAENVENAEILYNAQNAINVEPTDQISTNHQASELDINYSIPDIITHTTGTINPSKPFEASDGDVKYYDPHYHSDDNNGMKYDAINADKTDCETEDNKELEELRFLVNEADSIQIFDVEKTKKTVGDEIVEENERIEEDVKKEKEKIAENGREENIDGERKAAERLDKNEGANENGNEFQEKHQKMQVTKNISDTHERPGDEPQKTEAGSEEKPRNFGNGNEKKQGSEKEGGTCQGFEDNDKEEQGFDNKVEKEQELGELHETKVKEQVDTNVEVDENTNQNGSQIGSQNRNDSQNPEIFEIFKNAETNKGSRAEGIVSTKVSSDERKNDSNSETDTDKIVPENGAQSNKETAKATGTGIIKENNFQKDNANHNVSPVKDAPPGSTSRAKSRVEIVSFDGPVADKLTKPGGMEGGASRTVSLNPTDPASLYNQNKA